MTADSMRDESSQEPEPSRRPSSANIERLTEFFRRPLDIRSLALTGLFLLALFYTVYFTRTLLLPIVLAILLSFLLAPLVRGLARVRIPLKVGAALVMISLLFLIALGFYRLSGPAAQWMEQAPESLRQLEADLRLLQRPVEKVTEAAEEVERITSGGEAPAQRVETSQPSLTQSLFAGTRDAVAALAVVFVLLYFLLASGDLFLRKLIRVLPRFEDKRKAAQVAQKLEKQISLYLLTVTMINSGLGVAVGFTMYLIGMPSPILWGVMAAAFNFVPYLGALVGISVVTLVAYVTFQDIGWALMTGAAYLSLTALEGNFITPMLLAKRLTLNPVVVFLSLLFWLWLWGIPGGLLAVPILATFKIICDEIEPLAPIGEFLGR
jgi:predicted PurR-regulated permease PerM